MKQNTLVYILSPYPKQIVISLTKATNIRKKANFHVKRKNLSMKSNYIIMKQQKIIRQINTFEMKRYILE